MRQSYDEPALRDDRNPVPAIRETPYQKIGNEFLIADRSANRSESKLHDWRYPVYFLISKKWTQETVSSDESLR